MVREEDALDDDNSSNHSECTTQSSDSYSYLFRDVENPNNHINEEWEAIERTLYQESGKHVTDPVLLKECKLWRETFPHFRVKGTAVKVEQHGTDEAQSSKSVQSIDKNHLPLSKLNEKREKIKKTVVSQIVDRLISKLNVYNGNFIVSEKLMDDKDLAKPKVNVKSSRTESEVEYYYERGKHKKKKGKTSQIADDEFLQSANLGICQTDEMSDLFDDFESNFSMDYLKIGNESGLWSGLHEKKKSNQGSESFSHLAKNEEILRSGNITFKIAEKNSSIQRKRETTSDSPASRILKPFEMTKKIDKKYESMLEKILENKGFITGDAKKSSRREVISCRKSMENITGKRDRDYVCNGKKQLPKLNNFKNNWIIRGDQHSYDPYSTFFTGNQSDSVRTIRNIGKQSKFNSCRSANNVYQCDEKFLEEIGREMRDYKTSLRKDYEEEINVRRPQFRPKYEQKTSNTAKTQKSLSCGDLPKKKNPKSCNRTLKNGLEKGKSELTVRNGAKKKTGNQNLQLPPIETSIICTEITGRPKVAPRSLPKKYI